MKSPMPNDTKGISAPEKTSVPIDTAVAIFRTAITVAADMLRNKILGVRSDVTNDLGGLLMGITHNSNSFNYPDIQQLLTTKFYQR
jgi:hypothetical protein